MIARFPLRESMIRQQPVPGPNFPGLLLLCSGWLVAWFLADPRGEFPLNDDWAYAIPVQRLLDEGRLELTDWGGMTLVFHVAWGAIFCLPLGFSFLALRVATLAMALVGIMAFYGVLREACFRSGPALIATATLAFNPLFFHLSHTYMTDVSFCGIVLLSVYLWLRWIRSPTARLLALSLTAMILATLIRQVGVAIGLAAAVSCLLRLGVSRQSVGMAALLACGPMVALFVYYEAAEATIGLPLQYVATQEQLLEPLDRGAVEAVKVFLPRAVWRGMGSYVYLGLFCLPLALSSGALSRVTYCTPVERRILWVAAAIGVAVLAVALLSVRHFPHFGGALPGGNIVIESGLGPATLSGSEALLGAPKPLGLALTLLGALGGIWVTQRLLVGFWRAGRWVAGRSVPDDTRFVAPWLFAFGGLAAFLLLAPLLLAWVYFDRYLLTSLPFIVLVCAVPEAWQVRKRAHMAAAWSVISIAALTDLTGTHDYFSWNRARWAILDSLQGQGVEFPAVDGGYEFNMWHRYRLGIPDLPRSDELVISFEVLTGYRVADEVSYRRLLPPGEGQVYLLRRVDESHSPAREHP